MLIELEEVYFGTSVNAPGPKKKVVTGFNTGDKTEAWTLTYNAAIELLSVTDGAGNVMLYTVTNIKQMKPKSKAKAAEVAFDDLEEAMAKAKLEVESITRRRPKKADAGAE